MCPSPLPWLSALRALKQLIGKGRTIRSWRVSGLENVGVIIVALSMTACQEHSDSITAARASKIDLPQQSQRLDRGTIFRHLSYIMDIQNEAKDPLFVRWERPVRYYIQGLDDHPELIELFEHQVAKIAKYTRLDIKRHDDLYLQYRDDSLNDRASWPDGLSTVAGIFFSVAMEASFEEPKVVKIIKAFGGDPALEYLKWKKHNAEPDRTGQLGITKHGLHRDGLRFSFFLLDTTFLEGDIRNNRFERVGLEMLEAAFEMVCPLDSNDTIPSILNKQAYDNGIRDLTEFDKALLEVYYGPAVKSGMTKLAALLEMNEILVRRFESE